MSTFAPVRLSDGTTVPGIGFGVGTAHFGNDSAELVETVKTAIKVGYTHLDGAEAYAVSTAERRRSRTRSRSVTMRQQLTVLFHSVPTLEQKVSLVSL